MNTKDLIFGLVGALCGICLVIFIYLAVDDLYNQAFNNGWGMFTSLLVFWVLFGIGKTMLNSERNEKI